MTDLLIYETGNGGDILIRGNDAVQVYGYENSPYLAMFGGADYFGNYLIQNSTLNVPGSTPPALFSSQTEQVLKTTPLTSAGRITILNAMNADLAYLNNIPGTTWNITLSITGPDRLEALININGKTFAMNWNPDKLFLTYQV